MAKMLDSILHPVRTVKHTLSKEAVSYNKEEDAILDAETTAEKLCNADDLLNVNLEDEMLKLDYYNQIPGIQVDSSLKTYLGVQNNTINQAKNLLSNLKSTFVSQTKSVLNYTKYLKNQVKTIIGYRKEKDDALKSRETSASPLECLLRFGKGITANKTVAQARKALAAAKGKKTELELKVNSLKGELDTTKAKINEHRTKISEANKQVNLYKSLTDSQFKIADQYIAIGSVAKQTGLAEKLTAENKLGLQNKKFLESLPDKEAKNLLRVLSEFPINESKPNMVISFSGNGVIQDPNKTALDIQAAAKTLEKLQLKYNKGHLLEPTADKGVLLSPALKNIVSRNRRQFIDDRIAANQGQLPEYILEQLENNRKFNTKNDDGR